MSRESYPKIRRRDRAKDEVWTKAFLTEAPMGQLAMVTDGQPYIVTNTFVYDPATEAVYIHTARHGHLREMAESGPARACFTCSAMGRLLPADTMKELSVEYASVVAFGTLRVVDAQAEQRQALEALAQKYFPHLEVGKDIRALTPAEVAETTVFRFDIEHVTGKQKKADDTFAGAFLYGSPPDSSA